MPIDFNPQVYNNVQPQIVKQQFVVQNQPVKDVFVKNANPLYDGIKIEKKPFGKIKKTGEKAQLYTITNKNGASVSLSSFGATITGIKIPDKNGKLVDVTHGYNNATPYEESPVGHAGGNAPGEHRPGDGKHLDAGAQHEAFGFELQRRGGDGIGKAGDGQQGACAGEFCDFFKQTQGGQGNTQKNQCAGHRRSGGFFLQPRVFIQGAQHLSQQTDRAAHGKGCGQRAAGRGRGRVPCA